MAGPQSPRHQKRSRASDAAEKASRPSDGPVKRRRTSDTKIVPKTKVVNPSTTAGKEVSKMVPPIQEVGKQIAAPWSFSRPVCGRYSNLDPIITPDEAYLFVGLDSAVQVFATSTSRLLRSLQLEAGQKVIGYKLCPINSEVLYIFTPNLVTKWDWDSGKRLARWGTDLPTVAVDVPFVQSESQLASYSIHIQGDGKRQISVSALGSKKSPSTAILHTSSAINAIQAAHEGRVILASDGSHLFLGTTTGLELGKPESIRFTWREAVLPVPVSCFHLRESPAKGSDAVDLAVGEQSGSVKLYHDLVNTLFGRNAEKKSAPRKLHWHRSTVSTVRWSKDGNYLLTGGQESVIVLWQLDTGRKQFLPHLSSPVANIVISPNGTSYVVKLTDNSVMVLSARELVPFANVTGLQLGTDGSKEPSSRKSLNATATLHPQHPEWLLVAVPASHQSNEHAPQHQSSAVLQTFDIRANYHISRQALARTNTTVLNVGPEGSSILPPDVQHMDIAQDGKWLATVDTWSPNPQDVEALARASSKDKAASPRPEVFLKFWKWSASNNTWGLVTRIDAPHFNDTDHSNVIGLAARMNSHEFSTLGSDAFIRFWCPTTKYRSGLKSDPAEQHQDTWKCRSAVDLTGCLDDTSKPLKDACMSFSEDGSVLAVCLPSGSGANEGLVLLIDARNGTIHYRRTGVFHGNPSSARFLGRYLIVASTGSVATWDTVDDVVKPIQLSQVVDSSSAPLIAVNPRTQSVAITVAAPNESSRKKSRAKKVQVQIYDVPSFTVVFKETLPSQPLALLADVYAGDYIILDATASVQRLGCLDKASQKSLQPREVTSHLNSGLASIFRGHESAPAALAENDAAAPDTKGLASVFGETPSFSLPALGVLFRNVVQTLGSS
ncbi:hypothetical protein N7492_003982 [Penicillium capsulatum]|uniref:WD40 repeat-like protein n=1 Tax=Penicillium capsulatum TaxID=69766 RepID=A0A9W9LXY9_9EURO|nr:hypothetical protein N7492_003982 [Penicillium capsulatum]KAJ6121442.1 hypothetical protein N7512_003907 [Penicillium capsulatum]